MKGTDAMLELIKSAKMAGHKADYVLSDTCFSGPAQLMAVKSLDLDPIAMIKKSSKIRYEYNGELLSLNAIYSISRNHRGCSKYLFSVDVKIGREEKLPTRIVCVRSKNKKNDWIAFICTDMSLSPKEIIRIYGKRWHIEVFFKTCKSYLKLTSECHSLSFDALTAHVAVVFVRYMMIALEQRKNQDNRTLGELFCYFIDEMKDITFSESYQIILRAMFKCIYTVFHATDDQINEFIDMFIGKLPAFIRNSLIKTCVAT